MSGNLKLPVGIDDFRKIRECGFTMWIRQSL